MGSVLLFAAPNANGSFPKKAQIPAQIGLDGQRILWVLDGPMNGAAFEAYLETQLAPTLHPGDVVIADNLSSHKSCAAQSILKAQGNWMLFRPPYSPDLNPIEMAFSMLKAHLRRLKARIFDTLFASVGEICNLFNERG